MAQEPLLALDHLTSLDHFVDVVLENFDGPWADYHVLVHMGNIDTSKGHWRSSLSRRLQPGRTLGFQFDVRGAVKVDIEEEPEPDSGDTYFQHYCVVPLQHTCGARWRVTHKYLGVKEK